MNIGYQVSKNRLTTSVALTEEQSFRLRRLAADGKVKLSPFIGVLIDQEWERRKARELAGREAPQLSEVAS